MSLPVGFLDSMPYFSMATETFSDLENASMQYFHKAPPHLLKYAEARRAKDGSVVPTLSKNILWSRNSLHWQVILMGKVSAYLGGFISAIQGGPVYFRKVVWHFFQNINRVFWPNQSGKFHRKEPISTNKLKQGYSLWSTHKLVFGWNFNTVWQLLNLLPKQENKMCKTLAYIPESVRRCSVRKWNCLLGILWRITL